MMVSPVVSSQVEGSVVGCTTEPKLGMRRSWTGGRRA